MLARARGAPGRRPQALPARGLRGWWERRVHQGLSRGHFSTFLRCQGSASGPRDACSAPAEASSSPDSGEPGAPRDIRGVTFALGWGAFDWLYFQGWLRFGARPSEPALPSARRTASVQGPAHGHRRRPRPAAPPGDRCRLTRGSLCFQGPAASTVCFSFKGNSAFSFKIFFLKKAEPFLTSGPGVLVVAAVRRSWLWLGQASAAGTHERRACRSRSSAGEPGGSFWIKSRFWLVLNSDPS